MKASRLRTAAAMLAAAVVTLTGCGSDNPTGETPGADRVYEGDGLTGTLTGVGSSAQAAAMNAWKTGFMSKFPGVTVQYSPDGSGAGRGALLAGAADFAGSDAYLDEDELKLAEQVCGPDGAIDIPVYISPISLAFNIPGVDNLKLDAETIALIFRNEINNWQHEAIASQNPGVDLPDLKITAVNRSDDSGTTENFTDYLSSAASEVWPEDASGTWPGALQGENAKGNSGVVKVVANTRGSITYADDSAVDDTISTVSVKVGDEYVPVTPEAASNAVEEATRVEGRAEHDIALELDRSTNESGGYPIVLVSYHILCAEYDSEKTVEILKAFETYVLSKEGQQEAADAASSAPLPRDLAKLAQDAVESVEVAQ
ncbi:phosphate ABC transporter substrate-binding protein PstS [Arthrobacter sp. H14]|uniref:phosphate ABC transporter substrate-binding protein PstS n=1 Tax=Arthrobacter sp. H14 TaxID=1312959 RepID=UPI00047C82D8|nr:phosphate ABC transporter substrate-binding protein PstS [Arthrobacter sp. H14]